MININTIKLIKCDCLEQMKNIKDDGAILLFGSQPFTTNLNLSNITNYRYEWVWLKNNSTGFQLANKRPLKKT